MQEHTPTIRGRIAPDLLASPHVLPALMELFAGELQQAQSQQEQLLLHLQVCHYCRTAVVFLLCVEHEYDRRSNAPQEPVYDLLVHFAAINQAIEAYEYERLGAYAEAVVTLGEAQADQHFPDVAAHLRTCPQCRSATKDTITFVESETTN